MNRLNITPELVSRLVAAQFPQWAGLPVTPVEPGGWDNATFRLGEEMSVRLPTALRYVAQIDKEHRWLPVLAQQLPLPIPEPLARGVPALGYPWPWSVYRWLDGDRPALESIADQGRFATDLAAFLRALWRVDSAGGPLAGVHNFFRGGPLLTYDAETREAIAISETGVDAAVATEVWEAALGATWHGPPVWVHGDVCAANLLVANGRLSAVIDFGSSGVGDPACDLVMAWTFFAGESRDALRTGLPADAAMWARARGWALWKALITLAREPEEAVPARLVIAEVLAE